jgi:hypothetical protein
VSQFLDNLWFLKEQRENKILASNRWNSLFKDWRHISKIPKQHFFGIWLEFDVTGPTHIWKLAS